MIATLALLTLVHGRDARPAHLEIAPPRVEAAEDSQARRALVGREARDARLLRAAHAFERALTKDRTR